MWNVSCKQARETLVNSTMMCPWCTQLSVYESALEYVRALRGLTQEVVEEATEAGEAGERRMTSLPSEDQTALAE